MTPRPGNNGARASARSFPLWLRPIADRPWRAVIFVAGAGLLFLLVYSRILDERIHWKIGQRAPRNLRAHVDRTYESTLETDRRKKEAEDNAPDVYDEHTAIAARETDRMITDFFVEVNGVRREEMTDLDKLEALRAVPPEGLSHQTRRTLVVTPEPNLPVIEDIAHRLAAKQMERPIRDRDEELKEAQQLIGAATSGFEEAEDLVAAAVDVAQQTIQPNRIFNLQATTDARTNAADAVEPVMVHIRRNELIIGAGEVVEEGHIEMLNALGIITESDTDLSSRLIASAATIVGLLAVFGYYLGRFRRKFFDSGRSIGLLVGSLVTAAWVARVGAGGRAFEATDLAAVAALAIVLAVLLDTELAMVASVFMAIFADMAAPESDPRLLIAAVMAGTVAAFASGAGGSRPSMIMRTAVICAATNCFLAAGITTVFGLKVEPQQLGYAAFGGVVAAFFAAAAILVLERPLKIITEVRLLELSSTNEPVLRREALEAPGTYASSIAVASLAEPAAEAIGADSLLVRVGCYYHDIGKLKRPYYFIENQQSVANPHDRLTPHLSAKVIISHVEDGLEIADEIGLPAEVRAFVAEHHGTTLVEYFYEAALQEAEDPDEIQESAFRYEGPKPHSRETAILMLADTVEAASRTLTSPDTESVQTMIHNLIQHKIDDGQFDECNLTFADIHVVEENMVRSLCAAFHRRIKYPDHLDENSNKS